MRILPINVGRTNVQNPLDFVTALLVNRHKRGRLRHRGLFKPNGKKVNSMKYMDPKYCSFTLDTVENCCNLILNIVLYSVDRDIAEKIVLDNLDSSIDELKYTSIISVGHIVRIDKRISFDIINKLELLKNSGQFLGAISDVFDDINLFCDK